MDFGALLHTAQKNEKVGKKEVSITFATLTLIVLEQTCMKPIKLAKTLE